MHIRRVAVKNKKQKKRIDQELSSMTATQSKKYILNCDITVSVQHVVTHRLTNTITHTHVWNKCLKQYP